MLRFLELFAYALMARDEELRTLTESETTLQKLELNRFRNYTDTIQKPESADSATELPIQKTNRGGTWDWDNTLGISCGTGDRV